MTQSAQPPQPPGQRAGSPDHRLRDQAITALAPFFAEAGTIDDRTARAVAAQLLDEYAAATPQELQLAAQIIAFNWASLACVSASLTLRDASVEDMLRLQGDGIALDRLSHKATRTLDARRKARARNLAGMAPDHTNWDDRAFDQAIGQARKKMTEASARLASFMAALAPPPPPLPKLSGLVGEPMTAALLDRRRRQQS